MPIRCSDCGKEIVPETKCNDWLALWYFLEFLLLEGYIEKDTWDTMADRLETFKAFAMDWDQSDPESIVVDLADGG